VKLLKQLNLTSARSSTWLKRGVNEDGPILNWPLARPAFSRLLLVAVGIVLLAVPTSVRACAACYGQSDSPLASGVTWGILSLLVVVMTVLGSIVSFFVYIHKKSVTTVSQSNYQSQFTNH